MKTWLLLVGGWFFGLSSSAQTIQYLNPPALAQNPNYSQAVVTTSGKTIYISGLVSQDKSGNLVGRGDFRAQATQVLTNIRLVLEAAGASVKDIVRINTYMLNMDDLVAYREIRTRFFSELSNKPASTTVQVSRLFQEGYLLEIEVTAVVK
jgi:2-iminobutanoate/2-iminopropanoate deaminase